MGRRAGLIPRHGADALRYSLLREVRFDKDGAFTWERFDARYTADLADTLGNLVSRALTMIVNYRGGTVPHDPGAAGAPLEAAARRALAAYAAAMDAYDLSEGAAQLMGLATAANRYVEETAPYKLVKQAGQAAALDTVLANLACTVARLAVLAQPFLPASAQAIWSLFAGSPPLERVRLQELTTLDVAGRRVTKPPILFPKLHALPA